MLKFIKNILSFGGSLARVAEASNGTKCMSLK